MVCWFLGMGSVSGTRRNRVRHERAGIVAQPSGSSAGCLSRPARPGPRREEDVARVTADPVPGRSLVTRRAIRDLVRSATLSVVRRLRASPAAARSAGCSSASASPSPGLHLEVGDELTVDLHLDRRVRPARSPRSPARSTLAVRYAIAHALGREPDRVSIRIGRLRHEHGDRRRPPSRRPRATRALRPRGQRDGRRLMARRSCDGAGFLGGVPERGRQPRGERRRDQRAQRVPGARRRHRHEHAGDGPRGARGGGRAGPDADAERVAAAASFGALMGARGNSGVITSQILRGHRAGPRRQEAVQRPRPRQRARRRARSRLQGRREARRGHDPHRHPRGVRRRGRRRRARQQRRDGPGGDRRRGRARRREDAVAAADPARGARRRLGRPGPVPAVPGRARGGARPRRRAGPAAVAAAGHGGRRRRAAARPRRRAGVETRRVRLRDVFLLRPRAGTPLDVPAIQRHLESIGDSVLVAGDARAGQGPRPQRPPRRRHRVRRSRSGR